jgi:hypothetical protein
VNNARWDPSFRAPNDYGKLNCNGRKSSYNTRNVGQ